MTHRERLLATLSFEKVDRVPDYEFSLWTQTRDRWLTEGLPAEYAEKDPFQYYFGTENNFDAWLSLKVNSFILPGYETEVLETRGNHQIVRQGDGQIVEMMRPELGASIPRVIKYPIETRKDWEAFRDERLNPDTPGRLPDDIEERCRLSLTTDRPVSVYCGSIYGWLRNWMGVEGISLAIYDDPAWVEEMMEHLTRLVLTLLGRIAGKCRIDEAGWWEDMCFNAGPLVSPDFFGRIMVPRYKRITDLLKNECGCRFNKLDCDGNIHRLVPLWLEGGINVMFPLEAAHTDAYAISDEFGARMPLVGGINKLALIEGKSAIDRELERLTPLLKRGGFIPHLDHLVPPDVSFENYCYYRERKLEWIGKV